MKNYVYPTAIITEFYDSSAWIDISQYVVSDILGDGGFGTSDPNDFTATLGRSEFDLNNDGELFTVYGGDAVRGFNTLAGWGRGTKVRHRVVFDGFDEEFWFGFVFEVVSDDGTWGDQRVHVTCLDWMDVASRYPMKQSEILTNKTLAQGIQSITDRISVSPDGIIADPSTSTFPAIFDNVRGKTKAIGEIDKLARSELGRVYMLKDGVLRVEGQTSRKGSDTLDQVPLVGDNALLASADNALLVSADNALLIGGMEEANLTLASEKLDLRMANQLWNDAYIRVYPTVTDASLNTLHTLGTAIPIAAGQTINFVGNYTDPNGGLPINATNLQTMVSGTHYQMFANADGTGTDLTSFLTVTTEFFGDVFVVRFVSSYTGIGYITKISPQGFGIYRNNYSESHFSITGSAQAYGESAFEISQTYQTVPYNGQNYGASVLELYKNPKTRIVQARYCANISPNQMLACMHLDIGSLIKVYDNRSEMYKWYYIVSRSFIIALGGIIILTLGLSEHPSIASGGLSPVTVDFSGQALGDGIDFGYLPQVSGDEVTEFSIATWIYLRSVWVNFQTIVNFDTTGRGDTFFYLQGNGSGNRLLTFQSFKFEDDAGRWRAPTNALPTGSWTHIAVTYDINVSSEPIFYINGVAQSTTVEQIPSGTVVSSVGASLIIGNTGQYTRGIDALLKDVRIYNRILNPDDLTTLYNGGVVDYSLVTDGLVFQGLAINSDLGDASSLNGQQIPAGEKYFDNQLRMVGEPHGTPLITNE